MQVALKTLIVIHRTLREGDPTFREELLNFSQRGRILQLSNFKDDSSPIGSHHFINSIFFSHFLILYSYEPLLARILLANCCFLRPFGHRLTLWKLPIY